ncbi:MAG: alpha/beta hydrolase [Kineosporiaceae bacterium]
MLTRLATPVAARLIAYRLYHPPRRRHHRSPEQFGLDARTTTVTTDDGVDLHVWVVPGTGDRAAVVGHGIGLTKSGSLAHARLLADLGFGVVMFDHRNHGLSGRDPSSRGLSDRFTRDVEACVNAVPTFFPGVVSTVVWGFSFSSFPSFYALGRPHCEVSAVLCDSGPADTLEPLFHGFADAGALPLRGPYRRGPARTTLVEAVARTATAMLDARWPPPDEGRFRSTPALFLSGRDDSIARTEHVRALSDRYPAARTEVVAGGHLDGIKVDPEGYGARVRTFLEAALP